MKASQVQDVFREGAQPWAQEHGLRLRRRQSLLWETPIVGRNREIAVLFGLQVSSDGWDRWAGSKFRAQFSFLAPGVRSSDGGMDVWALLDERGWRTAVEPNNEIATRPPGPPSREQFPVPNWVWDEYVTKFQPTAPDRFAEIWLRYRCADDVRWWATFIGSQWPALAAYVAEHAPGRL